MQRFHDTVLRSDGRPASGATITVTTSAGAAATIYSGNGTGAYSSNVLSADNSGEYSFYAANGRYSINVAYGGFVSETRSDVVLFDPADAAAVSASNVSFSPTGTIAATNMQAAVAEVSGDVTALDAAKVASATLAASGGSALVGFTSGSASGVSRTLESKGRDIADLRDWITGAFNEANDYTTEFNAAVSECVGQRLMLPKGTIRTQGIVATNGIPLLIGQGTQRTKIVHIDGYAVPLFHAQGGITGTPTPAWTTDGFQGITFQFGADTTAGIYYDGHIDNNVRFDDLSFAGMSNTVADAISVRDFLNWNLTRMRWDGVGGWGIKVRDGQYFSSCHLIVDQFSYDNGQTGPRGQGLCSIDCSALTTIKGVAAFRNGRIELNTPLASSKPSRALFRAVQNTALLDASPAQIYFSMGDIVANAAGVEKDAKFVSTNYRNVGITIAGEVTAYGFNEFFNNDSGNATGALPAYPTTAMRYAPGSGNDLRYRAPSRDSQNRLLGMNFGVVDSDANFASYGRMERGDIAYFWGPTNSSGIAAGGRPFAYKAIQDRAGVCDVSVTTLSGTGSITSGTPTLAMTADIGNTIAPGVALDVAGAGAAGATLKAKIISVDYATDTITLDTNAGTTVAGATVTTGQVQYMAVDMVTFSAGPPASGSYAVGDVAVNTGFSASSPVKEYVCVNASGAGTWRASKWRVQGGSTAQRPTLTASDLGVMYLDSTLAAAGKPIWWTGSAWVDALGAAV